MKRGHVMGNKRERKPATPWWKEQEEAQIQKVEREWALRRKRNRESDERSPRSVQDPWGT